MKEEEDIRGTFKEWFIGTVLGKVILLYSRCLNFTLYDEAGIYSQTSSKPYIYAFWHNRILALGTAFRVVSPETQVACLTSASKDGAIIESVMKTNGIESVRGSSSRRGKAAMVQMIRKVRSGCSLAITPDGPRGPVYTLHMGVLKLASKTNTEIVAVQVDYADFWELKTWDGFRIPKPFSRVTICFKTPQHIPGQLSGEEEEKFKSSLEETLNSSIKYVKGKAYAEHRW